LISKNLFVHMPGEVHRKVWELGGSQATLSRITLGGAPNSDGDERVVFLRFGAVRLDDGAALPRCSLTPAWRAFTARGGSARAASTPDSCSYTLGAPDEVGKGRMLLSISVEQQRAALMGGLFCGFLKER
jgi:hypothetical protein